MKSNPIIPFGITMVLGIVLMFIVAFYGASQINEAQGKGGEKAGQTANANPEAIFKQNCSSCHGENLQGGAGPNLQHIGKSMSKKDISNQIKNGGGGMPAGVIKGEEAEKVATWLSKKK